VDWDLYASTWADQNGGYDQRRAPPSVRGWLRLGYRAARALAALRVAPVAVTVAGLALAIAVPLVAGRDPLGPLVAAGLVLLSSHACTLERALRVLTARLTPGTAIGEAVAARLGEMAWLAGYWTLGVPGWLVLACGALTGLYEYVRTQALAAGVSPISTQTMAERSMRVSVTVAGLTLAGLAGLGERPVGSGLLAIAALVWLILTTHGFGQLTAALRRLPRKAPP
jgi:hypothetical protein